MSLTRREFLAGMGAVGITIGMPHKAYGQQQPLYAILPQPERLVVRTIDTHDPIGNKYDIGASVYHVDAEGRNRGDIEISVNWQPLDDTRMADISGVALYHHSSATVTGIEYVSNASRSEHNPWRTTRTEGNFIRGIERTAKQLGLKYIVGALKWFFETSNRRENEGLATEIGTLEQRLGNSGYSCLSLDHIPVQNTSEYQQHGIRFRLHASADEGQPITTEPIYLLVTYAAGTRAGNQRTFLVEAAQGKPPRILREERQTIPTRKAEVVNESGWMVFDLESPQTRNRDIYRMQVGTTEIQPVVSTEGIDAQADITRDRRRIAFVSTAEGKLNIYNIYIAEYTGEPITDIRQARRITEGGRNFVPSWNSSGTALVFDSRPDGANVSSTSLFSGSLRTIGPPDTDSARWNLTEDGLYVRTNTGRTLSRMTLDGTITPIHTFNELFWRLTPLFKDEAYAISSGELSNPSLGLLIGQQFFSGLTQGFGSSSPENLVILSRDGRLVTFSPYSSRENQLDISGIVRNAKLALT